MNQFKLIILFLIAIIGNYSVVAQQKFERIYGGSDYDYGYSVVQTYDSGYIVAGATTSFGSGSTDAYLLKVDSIGNIKWHRTFGGINVDRALCIKETSDTGLIIAGYTNSFGFGGYDMYVIKINRFGDTIWTKTYGGDNWDFAYSIEQTSDGGYIITGGTYSYGNGNEDMYLVKINANGDTLWTKTYGGAAGDEAKSVKQTSDGGYIITGNTKSFGDSNGDIYIVKANSNGDTLWTRKYGGMSEDEGYDVAESYTGEFIIGGRTRSIGNGNFDGVIVRFSSIGLLINSGTYGGVDDDGIYSIKQSPNGRFAMLGYTYTYGSGLGTSEFLLYIENPFNGFHSGTFGGNKMEKGYCINTTNDNGYIICGNSTSYSNLEHIYLIKTDSNGVSSAVVNTFVTDVNSYTLPDSNFQLYPNPARDDLYLNLKTMLSFNNKIDISIVDIFGRRYYQEVIKNSSSGVLLVAIHEFPSGVYFVNIEGENVNVNQRLIIQR